MCDPVSIGLLAVSAVGAVTAKSASDDAVVATAEAQNRNTAEGYRQAQTESRAVAAQAMEKQTDRMRQASRQLALARVVAAEGGGSLASNAINIAAASDEDFSRIDAGLDNQKSTVRDQMAALQAGNLDAAKSNQIALKGNQMKFFTDVGGAAASSYVGYASRQSQIKLSQNYSASHNLKKAS